MFLLAISESCLLLVKFEGHHEKRNLYKDMSTPINRNFGPGGGRPMPHTPVREEILSCNRSSSSSSTLSTDSTEFWRTPPKVRLWSLPSFQSYRIPHLHVIIDQYVQYKETQQ